MATLKAVHYINQFFAGLGGEAMADLGLKVFDEKKGPALGLEKLWNGEMEVVKIIVCGETLSTTKIIFRRLSPKFRRQSKKRSRTSLLPAPPLMPGVTA